MGVAVAERRTNDPRIAQAVIRAREHAEALVFVVVLNRGLVDIGGHDHRRAGIRQTLGERAVGIGRWKLWAKALDGVGGGSLKVGEPGHGGKALTRGESLVAGEQDQAYYRNIAYPIRQQVLQ